jgi:hypothetical protein
MNISLSLQFVRLFECPGVLKWLEAKQFSQDYSQSGILLVITGTQPAFHLYYLLCLAGSKIKDTLVLYSIL